MPREAICPFNPENPHPIDRHVDDDAYAKATEQIRASTGRAHPTTPTATTDEPITHGLGRGTHAGPGVLRIQLRLPDREPERDQPGVRLALPIPDDHRALAGDGDLHAGPRGRHDVVTRLLRGQERAVHVRGADGTADLDAVLGSARHRPGAGRAARARAAAARRPVVPPPPDPLPARRPPAAQPALDHRRVTGCRPLRRHRFPLLVLDRVVFPP